MGWRRKWQPTPVFLPGESQGRGSLVGCHLQGRTESGTTEVTAAAAAAAVLLVKIMLNKQKKLNCLNTFLTGVPKLYLTYSLKNQHLGFYLIH